MRCCLCCTLARSAWRGILQGAILYELATDLLKVL